MQTSSFGKLIALVTVGLPLLLPTTSWAWHLESDGSYLVYECCDGARIRCVTSDDGGPNYQIDCVDGPRGDVACEGHGGYVGVAPGLDELACEYDGDLPVEPFSADDGDDAEINSTCTAGWVATCGDGETAACDETRQSCPAVAFEKACEEQGGTKSWTLYVAFTKANRSAATGIE